MKSEHKGGCLCGEVAFEIHGDFDQFFLCHCEYCRKDTGSAHCANLFSSTAKLHWICGQNKVTTFHLPSTRHTKSFCSICGSTMPTEHESTGMLVVPAGSLNTPLSIQPNAHIFMASKANWDDELEALPKMDRYPG